LPWNPLRLEQRVGRVDRLGQHRTVHAIRLFHRQTIEQRVLEHLVLRSRRAQDALERPPVTELTMANAIFGGVAIDAAASPSIATARVAGAAGEAQRIGAQRRAHQAGARHTGGLGWTAPRNGRPNHLILLTRRCYVNDAGAVICDAVQAQLVALSPIGNRRQCRQLIERARERLLLAPAGDIARLNSELDALRAPIVRRILAIGADAIERVEQQSSLFDHRSETAAMARDEAARKRHRARLRTLQAIASPAPRLTRVDLIAAWPVRQR